MYTFSSKLKVFSIILMVAGLIGIAYGFLTIPSAEQVEKIVAEEHSHATTAHNEHTAVADTHKHTDATAQAEHKEHVEHVSHQVHNRPWAAFYVAALFFFLISLGVLAFYAIQHAAQAGWSPVLFRVMEGITGYLLPGSIIVFLVLVAGVFHHHHLFVWMDKEVVETDKLIQGKLGWMNPTRFLIFAAIYIVLWNGYRYFSRKLSLAQDAASDNSNFKKIFKFSAGFLVIFIVTESMMAWDWVMSVDPHWYSTLFGWYVFASFFVSGITTITMVTFYLKSKGYLEYVNKSHIHDLAKFMFGISVFWTYLWFSQFMLMWYSNIPEEVTYFVTRINEFRWLFWGMVILNFLLPLLILVSADMKRIQNVVIIAGMIILMGHYVDFYVMIMPATVGSQWQIGIPEIGSVLFFLGLFIFIVFTTLTKAPLLAKGNPYIEESKHFHY